ncbi:hypothetical protein [Burkholderia anthina]|uniref:hypothetical protein n=1 Tax=Burkholderia anthina TaxID=179879 RepID=UPI0037BF5956
MDNHKSRADALTEAATVCDRLASANERLGPATGRGSYIQKIGTDSMRRCAAAIRDLHAASPVEQHEAGPAETNTTWRTSWAVTERLRKASKEPPHPSSPGNSGRAVGDIWRTVLLFDLQEILHHAAPSAPLEGTSSATEELAAMFAHCRILESRIERYQSLCAAAYQLAGAVDAPVRFLDALSEGANGNPPPEEHALALLPVTAAECGDQPPHADDVAVDDFAAAMKAKLADARAKGRSGWETCDPADLSRMLRDHVDKGDPRDVANFCMFLYHHGAAIAPTRRADTCPHGHTGDWSDNCPNCRH